MSKCVYFSIFHQEQGQHMSVSIGLCPSNLSWNSAQTCTNTHGCVRMSMHHHLSHPVLFRTQCASFYLEFLKSKTTIQHKRNHFGNLAWSHGCSDSSWLLILEQITLENSLYKIGNIEMGRMTRYLCKQVAPCEKA